MVKFDILDFSVSFPLPQLTRLFCLDREGYHSHAESFDIEPAGRYHLVEFLELRQ